MFISPTTIIFIILLYSLSNKVIISLLSIKLFTFTHLTKSGSIFFLSFLITLYVCLPLDLYEYLKLSEGL